MRRLGLLPLLCAALSAQTAIFEGTAVNSADGRPISGVHISLIGFSLQGIRDAYGAMSDEKGHFSIASLPAGTYVIVAQRRGFIHLQEKKKGGLPIPTMSFKAGEAITGFALELTPRAMISGRVVDEFGDPVQNAEVRTEPVSPDAPVALNLGPDDTHTDDRGIFRLSGAPGRLYVHASPAGNSDEAASEVRTDGTSPTVYTTTWYPNAASQERAAPVEAKAGAEVSGIEIRLARRAPRERTRGVTLSGTVHGFPAGVAATEHTAVWLMYGQAPDALRNANRSGVQDDAKFEVHTSPGFCRIWATYRNGKTFLQSDPLEFRANADLTGLDLALQPAGDLSGSVEAPGDRPGAPKPIRTVRIDETSADTGRDGVFQMSGVMPGRHKVEIDPLPENGYIESMVLDGAALKGPTLDVPRGVHAAKLKITVAVGASISGAVLDKDGMPLAGSLGLVMLSPMGTGAEPAGEEPARVDESGRYSIHGVKPGKYRIAAFDLLRGGFGDDPLLVLKKPPADGEEIEVKAGERLNKDLTLTEAGDAKK